MDVFLGESAVGIEGPVGLLIFALFLLWVAATSIVMLRRGTPA